MFDLKSIQCAIQQQQLDGWLLYDFRGNNPLAQRVLDLDPAAHATRRFFYFVPVQGPPRKLVHRIESGALDHLPGEKTVYLTWQELESGVAALVQGAARIAMEYSPRNANPYVARVDAGTIELVRSCGAEVVSSGDLVQTFEATWDDAQWEMHQTASRLVIDGFEAAWDFIRRQVHSHGSVRETEVQSEIMHHFKNTGLVTDHPPIVAVGPNSGNPHYAPQSGSDGQLSRGQFVLIDAWAKLDLPHAVYADYTQVAFIGNEVPDEYANIFRIVAAARDAGIERVQSALKNNQPLQGWQVDQAVRDVIEEAGYGEYFIHRTGHNIGRETHGNGANMDNLETHEERKVMPCTCFSIEPGIYLPEFGVRSEVNIFIDAAGIVHVTGKRQGEIRALPL